MKFYLEMGIKQTGPINISNMSLALIYRAKLTIGSINKTGFHLPDEARPICKKNTFNMKIDLKNLFVICSICTFFGCDGGSIELKIPAPQPKLAISCIFSPDRDWQVEVNTTQALGNFDPSTWNDVPNATVEIWEGAQKVVQLSQSLNGIYVANGIRPQIGKKYTLKVSAPNYPSITATSEIPEPVPISKAVFQEGEGNGRYIAYEVTFKDQVAHRNYYSIGSLISFDETDFNRQSLPINSDDPSIEGDELLGILLENPETRSQFSDERFDGQTYTIRFTAERKDAYSYIAILTHLSPELYQYNESKRIYNRNIERPFAEPSRIFTNIQGGVGIFAGKSYSYSEKTILDDLNPSKIAGEYKLTYFMLPKNRQHEDMIKSGAILNVKLNPNFTYNGNYFIPSKANITGTGDLKGDFSGSWKLGEFFESIELSSDPIFELYNPEYRNWRYSRGSLSTSIPLLAYNGSIEIKMSK